MLFRLVFPSIGSVAAIALLLALTAPLHGAAQKAIAQKTTTKNSRSSASWARVSALMDSAIAEHAFPSAVVGIIHNGNVVFHQAYGRFTYEASATKATLNTVYDMASLTKVLCTTTCLMKLVSDGNIALDDKVSKHLPAFAAGGKQDVTIRNLLLHDGGFAPFRLVPKDAETTEQFHNYVLRDTIKRKPGDSTVYSDLGFITLGELVRVATGKRLDDYFAATFAKPLGLQTLGFNPPPSMLKHVATVETDSFWTWKKPRALVHDPRAAFTDGVSGHAGLFGTAGDVMKLMAMLMAGGKAGGKQFIKPEIIALFTKRLGERSSRALGWDTRVEGERSSAGTLFSTSSFGHTGFTGTSVWVDPTRKLCAVLLTNRVYPTSDNKKIIQIRPLFHNAVVESLGK